MYIMQYLGDFLLAQWIWCVTFDLSHFIFAFLIMFFILTVSSKERLARIGLISFCSYTFAFGLLFFLGVCCLSWMCNWDCNHRVFSPLVVNQWDVIQTNFLTGLIVTIFQALFFICYPLLYLFIYGPILLWL